MSHRTQDGAPLGWRALWAAALTLLATISSVAALEERPHVRLRTEQGSIEVELMADRAPITVANFLRYVDAGHYDGGQFHRTVRLDNQPGQEVLIEVVQAGVNPIHAGREYMAIPLERTSLTNLQHLSGSVSMARAEPDSATSDFFICIGDQPELDFGGRRNSDGQGFAAFGRVVEGMDVVLKIQAAAADGQSLTPPVRILDVRRVP
jgi:peptidyl-prolyl cis-trans isomerase A (cyclophilin A)